MRRLVVLLATLCLLLVGLTACGGDDLPESSGAAKVTGAFGAEPTVTTEGEFKRGEMEVRTATTGKGVALEKGNGAFLNLFVHNAFDDETSLSSWKSGSREFIQFDGSLPGLDKALIGKKVGSRVVIEAVAKAVFGDYGQPGLHIAPEDPIVIVADIVSQTLSKIESDPAAHKAGDPKIVFEKDLPSSFDFTGATKPAASDKARLVTLTKGEGPAFTKGSRLLMRYMGQVWGGKEPFDENYSSALEPTSIDTFVPGWQELLPGVTVGSRVLLILPPDAGYGAKGNPEAGIKGTDTLVFVVDVLGVDEPLAAKGAPGEQE